MIVTDELQNIPKGWEIKPFKSVIRFGKGLSITKENLTESGVQCLNYGEIHSKFPFEVLPSEDPLPFVSPDYLETDEKSLVCPGDIVFADTSEDIEGAGNFTQIMGSEPIFAGYHTVITRPVSSVNHRYLAYVLESEEFRNQIRSKVKGVKVYSVTKGIIGNTRVWFPEAETQRQIASYLDVQTKRIDALVDEKQRFIDLLKEKRQALISHFVTKGLDDNVPMKDSGVEWIGEVPTGFEIVPLMKLVIDKSDYRGKTPEKSDSGVFLVTAKNIRMGYIDYELSKEFIPSESYEDVMSRGKPEIGDILFTTEAPLGNVALVDKSDFALAQRVVRFRVDPEKLDNRFALYSMMSEHFQRQIGSLATGITAQGIKASKFNQLKVTLPRLSEQQEIVALLDRELSAINQLVTEVDSSIELLKEHRTALISAAVTGKIDVRGMIDTKDSNNTEVA